MKKLTKEARKAICALLAAVMALTNTGTMVFAQESALAEETQQEFGIEETVSEGTQEDDADDAEAAEVSESELELLFSDTDIAHGEYKEDGNDITWVIDADGKLTVEGRGDYKPEGTWLSPWYSNSSAIKTAEIKVTGMKTAVDLFYKCINLTSVDLSGFDTSRVTNMQQMFCGCSSLESVDLSGFNTSKVTNMKLMFNDCSKLKSLDLSGFDTSRLTNMSYMFDGCSSLKSLDLSGFDLSSVSDIYSAIFEDLKSLSLIYTPRNYKKDLNIIFPSGIYWYDISGKGYSQFPKGGPSYSILLAKESKPAVPTKRIKATKETTSYYVGDRVSAGDLTVRYYDSDGTVKILDDLYYLTNAASIDTSKSGEQTLTVIYNGLTADVKLTVYEKEGGGDTEEKKERIEAEKVKTSYYVGDSVNTDDLTVRYYGSDGSEKILEAADYTVSEVDTLTAGVKTLTITYKTSEGELKAEIELTVSEKEDIANGNDNGITWAIDGDGRLSAVGTWDDHNDIPWSSYKEKIITANIKGTGMTDASGMFSGYSNLKSLDLSGFDTSGITDMSNMFYNCTSLTDLDLSRFDTGSVTDMSYMFDCCEGLTSLDVSGFNTGSVTDMSGMFSSCKSLTNLDLSRFNTSNVTDMSYMFFDCTGLTSVDVNKFDTDSVTNMSYMFYNCCDLIYLDLSGFNLSSVTGMDGMFEDCSSLSSIYTPINLKLSVALPSGTGKWYDISGEVYTEFPTERSYSILLKNGEIPTVSTMRIEAEKVKTSYYVGDSVNTDDLTVRYYGSDGSEKILEAADYTVSEVDTLTAGVKILTITYQIPEGELKAEIELTVSEKEGGGDTEEKKERIEAEKVKTSYYVGDSVNTDDLTVKYYGSDGSEKILEAADYTVSEVDTLTAGVKTLTITYQIPEGELKAEIELTVSEKEGGGGTEEKKERIEAEKVKTSYYVGDTVNTDDLTVRYYGSDGSEKILEAADYTVSEVDTLTAGVKTLTITYQTPDGELKAEIELTVSEKEGGTTEGGSAEDKDDSAYEDSERISLISITTIANIKAKVYDQNPYEPAIKVTVSVGGKTAALTEGADYRVLYADNIDAGTATVTVKGNGIYKDSVQKSYTISPKPVKKLKVIAGSIAKNTTVSDLSALPICVYDGAKLLQYGTDYTLSNYGKFKSTASVTVTGAGNYKDSVKVKLTIYDADADHTINPADVSLSAPSFAYTGKAVCPGVSVTVDGNTLINKTDYKIQYQNNKNAGTAYVVVTGKGAYKGKAVVPFTINAQNVAANEVSIKDIPAKTYNGKLQKPSVTVSVQKDGKSKKLAKNKDYTVSYKDNFHAGEAVITITGKGNYDGLSATKKFIINPQKISKASLKGTQSDLTLTYGKRKLKEGTDYETPVYGTVNKNKVQVTIKGKGDFTGEMRKSVKISF